MPVFSSSRAFFLPYNLLCLKRLAYQQSPKNTSPLRRNYNYLMLQHHKDQSPKKSMLKILNVATALNSGNVHYKWLEWIVYCHLDIANSLRSNFSPRVPVTLQKTIPIGTPYFITSIKTNIEKTKI